MKASLQTKASLALLAGDLIFLTISLALGTFIRLGEVSLLYEDNRLATALCLIVYPLSLYLTRAYEVQPEASAAQNLRRPLLGLLFAIIATSFFFYLAPPYRFPRGIFAAANLFFAVFLILWRLGFFLRLRRRSLAVLLMGNPIEVETARQLIREFSPSSKTHVWRPEDDSPAASASLESSGDPAPAEDFDLLVLAGESLEPAALRRAAAFRLTGVRVWNLPRLCAEFAERLPAQYLDERWLATAEGFHSLHEQSFHIIKRLADITLASGGLILASPLLLVAAVLVKVQDSGPVFYSRKGSVSAAESSGFTSYAR